MLDWYKKLYIGENAKKDVAMAKWRLNHGKLQMNMFLITYASNPENLFDIIGTEQLLQKTVHRRCPIILGLAASKEEAIQIVQQIIEETYAKQKDVDVRRYLAECLLDMKENKKQENRKQESKRQEGV